MIAERDVEFYREHGYLVVENVFTADEVAAMRAALTELVAGAAGVIANDKVYDLEPSHTPEAPRVRRIKNPVKAHSVFGAMARRPALISVLSKLVSPSLRLHGDKINIKAAHYGSPVEWHQDWAFYPHTNDDVLAVGVLLDDATPENGPLMVIPGSHKGPTWSHHVDGRFAGAMDPAACNVDFDSAVSLLGKAGGCTFHHVRAIHGSAQNTSGKDRPLLLYQIAAADAWDLRGMPADWDEHNSRLIAGEPTLEPRVVPAPIRLPYPPPLKDGSIYENQSVVKNRFFAFDPKTAAASDAAE
ncbi:MAG: phytanoyl-CoA dioxygenase family protein [Alphaproteobacteria bacterium]|nr:phytanoyl-CoA dioxygenase family protein [Alphaproteobacteria bacterium]